MSRHPLSELSKVRRKAKRPCSGDFLSVGDGDYLIGAAAGAIQQIVRSFNSGPAGKQC